MLGCRNVKNPCPHVSSPTLTSFVLNGCWLSCRETSGVPMAMMLLEPRLPSHPFPTPGRLSGIKVLLGYLGAQLRALPGKGRLVGEEDCVAHAHK